MGQSTSSRLLPAGTVTVLVTEDRVELFGSPTEAVAAALAEAQASSSAGRTAITTGEARQDVDGRYSGPALDRGLRLHAAAHPGQRLVSAMSASLIADALPNGTWLADLGVHRLGDLLPPEHVFALCQGDRGSVSPALSTVDCFPNNLPSQLTSFIGRAEELSAITQLLRHERLVTLTGAGGCGKTRVALHAAAEQVGRWPDGIWWVELGSLQDPAAVATLVASVMGVLVEPTAGALQALDAQLRDRRFLVCLDNCEHLLDASAELAEVLVRSCPEASVLATSRELLGAAGEKVWRVPPLAEHEAVELLVERASRVRPWVTLDDTNETAMLSICRQLDGIPLAIELAAAWLRAVTPAEIAKSLDQRLALSAHGPRRAVPRHQTLAASIGWSHDLLDEADRSVIRRLAVFAGGFTLDAAEVVAADNDADVVDSLARLVDKSLVVVDERDGAARYRLLETIRQYARDRLAEANEERSVRDRHLDYYLSFAEGIDRNQVDVDQDAALNGFTTEHDNLRAALEWAFTGSTPERARRLAAAMWWLWYLRGHIVEGHQDLRRAIALAPGERSPLQARLHIAVGLIAVAGGQFTVVAENAKHALDIAVERSDETNRARALLLLAIAHSYVDYETFWRLCAEARDAGLAAGDRFVTDGTTMLHGVLLANQDRYPDAIPFLREAAACCLLRNDRHFGTMALRFLEDATLMTGDVRGAVTLAEEALAVARPLGDYYSVGQATAHLAQAMGTAGDIDGGRRLLESVVRSIDRANERTYIPRLAAVMGALCLWAGDYEDAVEWFERDVRHADPESPTLIAARSLPGLAAALRNLGRRDEAIARATQAHAAAIELELPHLVADALEQSALLAAADDPGRSEDLHHHALALRVEHGLRTAYVDSLDALALLAVGAESWGEAVRVLAASDAARLVMCYPRPPAVRPGHDAALAALRANLGDEAFSSAWREGTELTLDEAVAYVRRARGERGRPSTGWTSLTPTELDVVRLVAEGLSNPEIGARLFISRGTVKTHLSHIFAKLGVANRTELATLASARSARE